MATVDDKKNHLIVLIHGLWGSSKNLARLESVLHHSFEDSDLCTIHTYAPECFSHFKTYDGIALIGDYIIPNLFDHLAKLHHENGILIDEISFIGYSLGGLITRYIIGELSEIGFFDKFKPGFLTTFASPHLGVTFYNGFLANLLGSNLLGQTGKDLFMVDGYESILYKLSDPKNKYLKALDLFDTKISIANVQADRTVGFYSAFMTKYDVFKDWEDVDPEFITDLPKAILKENNDFIEPFIIDFKNSERLNPDHDTAKNSKNNKMNIINKRVKTRMVIISVVVTMIFPVILSFSLFGTIRSFLRNKTIPKLDILKLYKTLLVKLNQTKLPSSNTSFEKQKLIDSSDGYNEEEQMISKDISVSQVTREVVENGLNLVNTPGDIDQQKIIKKTFDTSKKVYSIDTDFELEFTSRETAVENLVNGLVNDNLSNIPLTKNIDPLPFSEVREEIFNNLNSTKWTKIAVLLHSFNAHQSVVGRRGFDRAPESIPLMFLYSFLVERSLQEHKKR